MHYGGGFEPLEGPGRALKKLADCAIGVSDAVLGLRGYGHDAVAILAENPGWGLDTAGRRFLRDPDIATSASSVWVIVALPRERLLAVLNRRAPALVPQFVNPLPAAKVQVLLAASVLSAAVIDLVTDGTYVPIDVHTRLLGDLTRAPAPVRPRQKRRGVAGRPL